MSFQPTYATLYERLMTNIVEDGECWCGTERKGVAKSTRGGRYPRVNVRIRGRHCALSAHIVVWVWGRLRELWGREPTTDELWWAYWEFRCSGLEIDHQCEQPLCRRPDHLQPATRSEQEQFKHNRSPRADVSMDDMRAVGF